ncbi:MAG: biopolymer transporter ExbD [Pirellulaceae bacterium]|jgi:biopolymer transport protein ExbD|nr:biopolymer transporter ExbD [Planctomycetaceae bacterium]MDP6466573.1 biopolymer transporter ExbD [Pirellulaceae bacterium]MDP6557396.1 biopolymer transporter ExbD [Pirellulaceae bacterium]
MPIKTTQSDEQPSLNLTPMIDVVFLLIIFFMAGTKFTELERKIALQVPQVADLKALSPAPERRVINVYRDGSISLDRMEVTVEQLVERLSSARGEYAQLGVVVRGDATGEFQNVASVLGACRRAGIQDMGISVRLAQRETR